MLNNQETAYSIKNKISEEGISDPLGTGLPTSRPPKLGFLNVFEFECCIFPKEKTTDDEVVEVNDLAGKHLQNM